MRIKTNMILRPSWSSAKIPTADSYASVNKITSWTMAGSGRSRVGRGGIPKDMEERDINTVVW